MTEAAMPLTMVAPGRKVQLQQVFGGEASCRRLAELGLTPGVEISVLQDNGGGPLVLCVRDTRIALGRGMAHKVMVIECDETCPADCPQIVNNSRKPIWMRGRGSCCDPESGADL